MISHRKLKHYFMMKWYDNTLNSNQNKIKTISDFAEIWTYKQTQHEKFKNGICKPFFQIHVTCWYQVTETVYVSSFWVHFCEKSSFLIHIWWNNNFIDWETAYINSFCNLMPTCDMVFCKMVFKFQFWIPRIELNYMSNFQQNCM